MTDHLLPDPEPERYELFEANRYRFDLDRRDFLRVFSVVGGGLLVVASVPAGAQMPARARARAYPPEVSSWLHIDERGQVTVYTGKVELGQNIRTSLAQAVADELRAPLASITLVMADTDLVPFDAGTFGSLTTPQMAPQLSKAAAVAREMLIDQAASRWQVDRGTLKAEDGRVVSPNGRAATYGELTRGQKLTGMVSAETQVERPETWKLRGQPIKKVQGREFVTGRHHYIPDMSRPGMLHGRVVRPERLGATLQSVDAARARAMPGVTVVQDGEFVGVVAPTERAARRTAAAVKAVWKSPGPLQSSSTVFEHLRKTAGGPEGERGAPPHVAGDVAAARAQAARTFATTYRIPYIAHVPLEPHAAVAEWNDGKVTVWAGTQRPFDVRAEVAEAFRLPEDRVRVIVPDVGSAYGGKHRGEHAIEAARLAKAAGRPVKLVWTRDEEFMWGYFRPAGVIDIVAATDARGRLVAWEFENYNSGGAAIRTPYAVPNQRIAFRAADSPLRQGSYRALAANANNYAREMHMDLIARALGADAVEFRLQHLEEPRLRAVLEAAAKKAGWPRPSRPGRAMGIACGAEKGSVVATVAELSRTGDGFRVERLVTAFECGAIVNPDGLRNQAEGCVMQALGGALFEQIDFADGHILNGSLAQYRVPRFKDVVPMEFAFLDRRDLPSVGAGETPMIAVAPAIGSAARQFGTVDTALPVRLV
ncbi:MAG TPA: molybdopterin cofactor-binding domain-containing protein [Vicinamibacterales bacterium]|nr:molybdopterin cofactor-binding domain-containing protein [Vicinamibacterales bacterium]